LLSLNLMSAEDPEVSAEVHGATAFPNNLTRHGLNVCDRVGEVNLEIGRERTLSSSCTILATASASSGCIGGCKSHREWRTHEVMNAE